MRGLNRFPPEKKHPGSWLSFRGSFHMKMECIIFFLGNVMYAKTEQQNESK